MKIKIFTVGKKKLVGEYNVRSVYEGSFYHRNMPVLSARRCREILNTVYPNFKAESALFVIENVETGYTGSQNIYRKGTVLNF